MYHLCLLYKHTYYVRTQTVYEWDVLARKSLRLLAGHINGVRCALCVGMHLWTGILEHEYGYIVYIYIYIYMRVCVCVYIYMYVCMHA
jgi:hypothetical protein